MIKYNKVGDHLKLGDYFAELSVKLISFTKHSILGINGL